MFESSESITSGRSKNPKERLFRNRRTGSGENNFGTVVRALSPIKPAVWLAQKLGCTERAAQLYIDGERGIPAPAIAVIINEMLK
jgi:hypothetical protein